MNMINMETNSGLIFPETFDTASDAERNQEIIGLASRGYDIKVRQDEDQPDKAYDNLERIGEVYDYLRLQGLQLEREFKQHRMAESVLTKVLNIIPANARKKAKKDDAIKEAIRERLLFGEDHTNSMPWHKQRGRAHALLTITSAHSFSTELDKSGEYEYMGGPLTNEVFNFQFEDNDFDRFSGLTLREAMHESEIEYSRKTPEAAESRTKRRLDDLSVFLESPVTENFKKVIQYCYDSLGIRERKNEVNRTLLEHISSQVEQGREVEDMIGMSFGCGTALPILEAAQTIKQVHGESPTIILLDQDPLALASASILAKNMGLGNKIELHCRKLFSEFGRPLDLNDVLDGRKLDFSEDSGLREYLPDGVYKKLSQETWKNLRSGGLMMTGNMNIHRPQKEFLHGLMGWHPNVIMRSIEDGFKLHQASGIPASSTKAVVTRSGVYTNFSSIKP